MARIHIPQRSLGAVALLVPDYQEAIDYFVDTLGFTLVEDTALSEWKRWVLVSPGSGTALLLAKADGERQRAAIGNQSGGRVFLFLETDDFWRDYRAYRSRGVEFQEEPRQEGVWHGGGIHRQVWQPVGPNRTEVFVNRRWSGPRRRLHLDGSFSTDSARRPWSSTPCPPAGRGLSSGTRWLVAAMALAALSGAASAETWRGLTVAPENRCSPYERKRDYPYSQSVEQDIVRGLGAVYGPYTGDLFRFDPRHGHRAHRRDERGARLRVMRGRPGDTKAVRDGPPELDARLPAGEPPPEERKGRGRVAPRPEPVLVRREGARSQARLRAHRRPARGGGARTDSPRVREHSDGADGMPGDAVVGGKHRTGNGRRRRCALALRRQPQRPDHVQGGWSTWDRARAPFAPRVPVHARWGRGRRGLRVRIGPASAGPVPR